MKTIKTLIIATILVLLMSINANAIGKTEKGVLIGIGSMLLFPTLIDNANKLFGTYNNNQKVITQIIEPPKQRVINRVKVIEKVYYEPKRKFNHKRQHGEYRRYFKREYPRYAYRN